MTRILERAGHRVVICEGYDDVAEQLARGTQPDVVITDVVLEGATGHRVGALVRRMSPRTRVVFMSGYLKVAVPGAVVLRKPFTPDEVVDLVEQMLSSTSDVEAVERGRAFEAARAQPVGER